MRRGITARVRVHEEVDAQVALEVIDGHDMAGAEPVVIVGPDAVGVDDDAGRRNRRGAAARFGPEVVDGGEAGMPAEVLQG